MISYAPFFLLITLISVSLSTTKTSNVVYTIIISMMMVITVLGVFKHVYQIITLIHTSLSPRISVYNFLVAPKPLLSKKIKKFFREEVKCVFSV